MPPASASTIEIPIDPRYMTISAELPPSVRCIAVGVLESIGA